MCYADRANGLNTSAVTQLDGADPNVTFYGTFQHRNDLLCSDGTVDSRNLCNQNCSSESVLTAAASSYASSG